MTSGFARFNGLRVSAGETTVSDVKELALTSGTVADAGQGVASVTIGNLIVPPTADPHIVGALWNDEGTPTISAG